MKKLRLNIIITLFCMLCFYQVSHSQNINGFTIYASRTAMSSMIFKGTVTNWKFSDPEGYNIYTFQNVGSNTVTITAKATTTTDYVVMIAEGKRTHRFLLVYKDNITEAEAEHDFSDLKQLQKQINEEAAKPKIETKPAEPVTQAQSTPIIEQPKQSPVQASATNNNDAAQPVTKTDSYGEVITAANNAYSKGNYEDAKIWYTKALVAEPGNTWIKGQLQKIEEKALTLKESEANKQKRNTFQSYIDIADKYFASKDYENAAPAYRKALDIIPDDAVAAAKLKDTEAKQKALKEQSINDEKKAALEKNDKEFNEQIKAGDNALSVKSYDAASSAFTLSLSYKPNNSYALSKLKEIEKIKAKEETSKKDSLNNVSFLSVIAIADDAFKNNSFEEARSGYKEALKHKPGDAATLKQLAKIDAAIADYKVKLDKQKADKEIQDKFNAAMNFANNAFEAGEYGIAKEQLKIALQLKPNETAVTKKLGETEVLISKKIEADSKRVKDSINNVKFNDAIAKGQKALEIKDYKNAVASYQFAGSLKPAEEYPKQKIDEINAAVRADNERMAAEKKRDSDFKAAMEKAGTALKFNQLESAKKAYDIAHNLKPDNEDALNKLNKVTAQIDEIARKKANDEQYELALHNGDSLASSTASLAEALDWYKKAAALKPELGLAKKQIAYVERVLGIDAVSIEQKKKNDALEVEKLKFRLALAAFNQGSEQITVRNYEGALASYNEFLKTTYDTAIFNPYKTYRSQFELASGKIKGLEDLVAKNKKPEPVVVAPEPEGKGKKKKRKTKQEEPKPSPADNVKESTVIYFPNQKDIDIKDLKTKYPGIDFNAAPADQQFNKQEYSKQTNKDIKDIIEEKPRINISNTTNGIKLSCTGIDFKGDNAFFKFNIQNEGSLDFLTGPMVLTRNGSQGRSINLFPIYISEFPVVTAGKEKTIVYVTNAITDMDPDENFALELNDRLKKTKASVTIPSDVYNKEKQH